MIVPVNMSNRWIHERKGEFYYNKAKEEGYRSRASYKLKQIDAKFRMFEHSRNVLDLGAAPGGWSQIAAPIVGDKGDVIAMDILPMEPLPGVTFIEGDFTEQDVHDRLLATLNGRSVDLVMSDIAPNISGMRAVDQPKAMYLVELALDFAQTTLKPGGDFVVKVFQGEGFDDFLRTLRAAFERVVIRKPDASRPKSREVYMLARGFKGN